MLILPSEQTQARHKVNTSSFTSARILTSEHNALFSIHDTTLYKDTTLELCYKHHEEFVYILEGYGEISSPQEHQSEELGPGYFYYVGKGERHILKAKSDLRGICIFMPACRGDEMHDENGSYKA